MTYAATGTGVSKPESPDSPRNFPDERWPAGFVTASVIEQTLNLTHGEFLTLVRRKMFIRDPKQRGTRGSRLYREADMHAAVSKIEKMRREAAEAITKKQAQEESLNKPSMFLHAASAGTTVPYNALQSVEVFGRLRAGESPEEIVVTTGMHPSVVLTIQRDWNYLKESFNMPKDILDAINQLELPRGRIEKPQQLLRTLMTLIAERTCTKCNADRPCARACISCVVRTYEARKKKTPSSESAAEGDNEDMTIEDVSGSSGSATATSLLTP